MISGDEPPRCWPRTSLALELTITLTAAVAGILTAGALLRSAVESTRLLDSRNAAFAWIVYACLAGIGIAIRRRVPSVTVARQRRPLILLLSLALVWTVLAELRPMIGAADGLVGEYFRNSEWNGAPAFSAVDAEPSSARMRQRWEGAPPERFSVRWTGFLTVGQSDLYNFATASDDGSQLMVDNQVVVDNTGPHSLRTRSGSLHLDRGSYAITLRYVQYGAESALDWSWSRSGAEFSLVPSWALSQRRTTYAAALAARIVDWMLLSSGILTVLAAVWSIRAGLSGEELRLWAAIRRRRVTEAYANTESLVFSIVIIVAMLFMPWEAGGQYPFYRSVEVTVVTLNNTAISMLRRFDAFQADINNPQPDESILPLRVQEMVTMLRGHELEQYQVSESIEADSWGFQQIVASAWPRKLEKDAKAKFVLNSEPLLASCQLIDKQREVSLVYCP